MASAVPKKPIKRRGLQPLQNSTLHANSLSIRGTLLLGKFCNKGTASAGPRKSTRRRGLQPLLRRCRSALDTSENELRLRQRRRIQPPNPPFRPNHKRKRQSIPVPIVERLPGLPIIAGNVRPVSPRSDPKLETFRPLHRGAIPVWWSSRRGPCPAAVG